MGVVVDFIAFVLRKSGRPPLPDQWRRHVRYAAKFDEVAFLDALDQLDRAQPSDVSAFRAGVPAACLMFGEDRRHIANVAMQTFPDAAWVLSLDRDGYVRAAALQRLATPACSPGRFAAIVLRLNDWVPEVRAEAVEAAKRVWPTTPANVIAETVPYLLRQRFVWRRWTDEALCVDAVLSRPDVVEALTSRLLAGGVGALGRTLSHALRFPAYEAELVNLATNARRPDVRATAIKSLLSGLAVWPVGYGWTWIDKSMGYKRRIMLTESRRLSAPQPPNLVEIGLADRSALVRKITADHIVEHIDQLPGLADIASRLVADKSPAVRERGDYLVRHLS